MNDRTDATSRVDPGRPGRRLLDRLGVVTRAASERAARYDRTATFPAEDFDDLAAAGLNAPTVPVRYGGLGVGPLGGDSLTLWLMTSELARADLSLARCWEGHANALVLIDALGSPEQKERWFDGVVRQGHKWVAWSGEPQSPKPGEQRRFGTTVTRVDGGWVLEGTKVFATSATGAQWAILQVNTAGPGGARHAQSSPDALIMPACDLSDPSVVIDGTWWDPIGMRATVSHLVRFDRTFLPDENLIGEPGAYLREGWQAAFVPHYAASFLGAAQAAYDYAVDYVLAQGKGSDPYVAQRVGAMAVNVETSLLWLRHVASLWDAGRRTEARQAGSRARHLIEHLALDTVDHCIRACGARSLVRPSPVERILRDLTFYVRHDNDDHVLATIGRAVLGQDHDLSFHRS
ncbi:MAG TPA: acyl-CoA dehydrogenase family protein [Mycobacteriales bacterium]|nr:acyl-CoA dehydrogenase family protein [Mycobacteriales bacterium]